MSYQLRTYDEARALVGTSEVGSVTFGRYKYVHYEDRDDGAVAARLFATDIVTWFPDGRVVLITNGWNTPTTFDGMAVALGTQRAAVGTRQFVPHLFERPFDSEPSFDASPHYSLTILLERNKS